MDRVIRRAGYYVLSFAALILVGSVVYDIGMQVFEPRPYPPDGTELSLAHSMQVVVETFTATGYGSDAPWYSTQMNALVILFDLTGVALFFLALPAVFVPLFQDALSASPPDTVEESLSDHVVVCTFSSRADVLVEELEAADVEYVLVEPDNGQATTLQAEGYNVVHAEPESVSDLKQTNLGDARALVADVSDRVDASIVLAAKEVAEDIEVISVIEEPEHGSYHRLAGADEVLMPRKLLGNGLAGKLTTGVDADLGEALDVGDGFDIIEVPIRHGSELAGTTLAESDIREEFGANVIGAWFRGEFESPPPPDRTLDAGTVLLVAGSKSHLAVLEETVRSTVRQFRRGETVIVGYGEVGKTIADTLDDAGMSYTTVDRNSGEGVDVVGDATDPDVLREAGVPEARSVVLAIPDDTTTEFATLVVRDLTDSTEIIARADNVEAIPKTYRAGADYVLSLATVSGRSVASAVIEGKDILAVGSTVRVIHTEAPDLAGETLGAADVRDRTGCTVIAIEREGVILTELNPDFRIGQADELVIAGTDEDIERFLELFTHQ